MSENLFEFRDYKEALNTHIQQLPQSRGFKASLAEAVGCQRAFISQVLQGDAHFNLEHGERVCRFLHFTKDQTLFFLLLIQYSRAGTEPLRQHFHEQIEQIAQRQLVIKNRIHTESELSPEISGKYYSSWIYGAIRVALTVPELRTRPALLQKLRIAEDQLDSALEFLENSGLVEKKKNEFHPTTKNLHLGNDSDRIVRHHTNWRLHTLEAIGNPRPADLHYSAVVSLSAADQQKLKALLVDFLEKSQKTIRASKEEKLCVLCADFFEF